MNRISVKILAAIKEQSRKEQSRNFKSWRWRLCNKKSFRRCMTYSALDNYLNVLEDNGFIKGSGEKHPRSYELTQLGSGILESPYLKTMIKNKIKLPLKPRQVKILEALNRNPLRPIFLFREVCPNDSIGSFYLSVSMLENHGCIKKKDGKWLITPFGLWLIGKPAERRRFTISLESVQKIANWLRKKLSSFYLFEFKTR